MNSPPNNSGHISIPYIEDIFSQNEIKEIDKWIKIYLSKIFFFREKEAIRKFKEFDSIFCKRTGLTQGQLFENQLNTVKRIASIKFSDSQNEFNDTMFNYPENQRVEAYKRFEKRYIALIEEQEERFPFRVFVATELGLIRRNYLYL
jgi:hypothetical protein